MRLLQPKKAIVAHKTAHFNDTAAAKDDCPFCVISRFLQFMVNGCLPQYL
jgi:hypothetical protein